jgi:nucleotide-binding universal stress UspA family protein
MSPANEAEREGGPMRLGLAVDLEDAQAMALVDAATPWAARTSGTLDLIFVQGLQLISGWVQEPAAQVLVNRELERMRAVSAALLTDLLDRVPPANRGVARVLDGSAIPVLISSSASYDALVVGTHGRRGLGQLWLGSVAEQIVRRAQCAVIVLRLPEG